MIELIHNGEVWAVFETMSDCWMQGIILLAIEGKTGLICVAAT